MRYTGCAPRSDLNRNNRDKFALQTQIITSPDLLYFVHSARHQHQAVLEISPVL